MNINKIKNVKNNVKNKLAKKDNSSIFLIIFVILFGGILFRTFNAPKIETATNAQTGEIVKNESELVLSFSDVLRRTGDIKTMEMTGESATGLLKDGTEYTTTIPVDAELLTKLSDAGIAITIDNSKSWYSHLGSVFPFVLLLLLFWWFFRGFKSGGGITKSLTSHNPTKITTGRGKTTFKDVVGIESAKSELTEVVDFLKNKNKFTKLGARIPRGVLLSGEPGTGKTLLARAIAGEAGVPFFAASGSDFSGIIVGLGVAKIKEIFEMAKRNAPSILFIDEIDAIGQKRSQHSFNDNDREQTLNQLLIEMDGFATDTGVIVIGATNRPDILDKALLRPGRFDRQVYIELPDLTGRREILDLYAKKVKVSKDVDMLDVARGTTGFSGADLENLLNEAALHAVRQGRKEVLSADFDEARDKLLMGPKKLKKMRPEDIKLTAYHEAGHAFISVMYRDITDPIHKATIVPRGRALGMVQHLPIDDKVSLTKEELRANLSMYLAGRAAEEIFFGLNKITTGAESDIAGATRMTRYAITVAGMSNKIGLVAINQVMPFGARTALENASEKTAEIVDAEVKSWMDAAYADAKKLINKSKTTVKKLAEELLKRETLTGDEITEIVLGKSAVKKKKTSAKKTTVKKK